MNTRLAFWFTCLAACTACVRNDAETPAVETLTPVVAATTATPEFPTECGPERPVIRTMDRYEDMVDCGRSDFVPYTILLRGREATVEWYPRYIFLDVMTENPTRPGVYAWPWIRNFRAHRGGEADEELLACAYQHGVRIPVQVRFCVRPNLPTAIRAMVQFGPDRRSLGGENRPLLGSDILEVRDEHGERVELERVSWDGNPEVPVRPYGLHFAHTPPFPGQRPL